MNECLKYIKESKRWLPANGKAPCRINTSSTDWNILDNQYYAREVFDYTKEFQSYNLGICLFKDDPILVIDVDKLSDEGIKYLNEHKTLPLNTSKELNSILNSLTIESYVSELSLSGKGLHIYILSHDIPNDLKSIQKINTTLDGMCDHIEVFNGGSNEDNSKGKFIVFTGNFIKDFTFDVMPIEEDPIIPQQNGLIYTDVTKLPIYTRKTTAPKLLDKLLQDEQFNLLYGQGILVNDKDINIDTLTPNQEIEVDTSKKVYRLVSILVSHCQVFNTIDTIFRDSFFYKQTHWGLEGKWERLTEAHNNSNPILSAFNTKVNAARALGKPDYTFFKLPYTTEVNRLIEKEQIQIRKQEREQLKLEKEKQKEEKAKEKEEKKKEKELKKLLEQSIIIEEFQNKLQKIIDNNTNLYTEYKLLDPNFKELDIYEIDEETIKDSRILCKIYWKLFPYTFAVNNDSSGNWVAYNKYEHTYKLIDRDKLKINIINFFMDLFPNKSHTYREGLAKATLAYYETLAKPLIDIYKTNSFLNLTKENEGYYYKVSNGILDVLNVKLLNDTPNFLSFDALPITIDDEFLYALETGDTKEVIKGTTFEKFITTSFPDEDTFEELKELTENPKLIREDDELPIYKLEHGTSNNRFAPQITVLQRMLGYTILPRHICNSDKALILYGVAGSGKSTLAKLMGYLLTGKRNLSGLTTSFSSLEKNQYALAPFKSVPLLVINELPDRFTSEIRGVLNALISGESVDINEKFKANYSMQLPCKLLLLGNVLPKIADESGSLARRSIVVNFQYNVSKTEKAIYNIDNKLLEPDSLKAFFLFCLKGAKDYLKNDYTVLSKIGLESILKMEKQNNPIEDVLKETVTFMDKDKLMPIDKDKLVPRVVLLSHIKEYINSSYNITSVTSKVADHLGNMSSKITSALARHFNVPENFVFNKYILGGKNKYKTSSRPVECFYGIELKDYIPEQLTELEGVFDGTE
jgi:hypothetical protein